MSSKAATIAAPIPMYRRIGILWESSIGGHEDPRQFGMRFPRPTTMIPWLTYKLASSSKEQV